MKQKLINGMMVLKYRVTHYSYRQLFKRLAIRGLRAVAGLTLLWFAYTSGISAQQARLRPNPDLLGPGFYQANESKTFRVVRRLPNDYIVGGSGSLIKNSSGRIFAVTNAHVCRSEDNEESDNTMELEFTDGYTETVPILAISMVSDICILGTPQQHAKEAFSLAPGYFIGEYVEAFGHPGLGPLRFSSGVIIKIGYLDAHRTIVTNLALIGGSSGSPVLNLQGQVIGLAYAATMGTNISYVVPLEDLRELLDKN